MRNVAEEAIRRLKEGNAQYVLTDTFKADIKKQGMVGVHLITAGEGILPAFYERYGFKKEKEVILMGLEL